MNATINNWSHRQGVNPSLDHNVPNTIPVKICLSSRQAGYSNRQQRQPHPEYKSDKYKLSSRYFIVGGQMANCQHILTGL